MQVMDEAEAEMIERLRLQSRLPLRRPGAGKTEPGRAPAIGNRAARRKAEAEARKARRRARGTGLRLTAEGERLREGILSGGPPSDLPEIAS